MVDPVQVSEINNFLTAVGGSAVGGAAVVIMARALLKRFLSDIKELKDRQDSIEREFVLFVRRSDCNSEMAAIASAVKDTLTEIKGMIKTLDDRVYSLVAVDRRDRARDENNR